MEYIEDKTGFLKLVSAVQKSTILGLDTETSGTNFLDDELLLLQLYDGIEIYVINVKKIKQKAIKYLISLIKDSNKLIVGHNLKFDLEFLYIFCNEMLTTVYDTQICETLTYSGVGNPYPSLEDLVDKYCKVSLNKEIRKSFIGHTSDVFTEDQINYSALDVKYLFNIMDEQKKVLQSQKQLAVMELENSLVPVFADMEISGIGLDESAWLNALEDQKIVLANLEEQLKEYAIKSIDPTKFNNVFEIAEFLAIPVKNKTKAVKEQLTALAPEFFESWIRDNFNPGSTYQMQKVLQANGINVSSTNENVISKFKNNELVKLLLDYKECDKKISTYGETFLTNVNSKTNRVHSKFNQTGTATGRISSSSPNMQNIPKVAEYRNAFVAKPGYKIIGADYSQAELRLAAEISREPEMIKAFKSGEDLHKVTAAGVYEVPLDSVTPKQRSMGKSLNFGLIYGISEYGLYNKFDIPKEEGKELLTKFFSFYKNLSMFISLAGDKVLEKYYSSTLLGRKRFFVNKTFFSDSKEKYSYDNTLRREGVNHIVQGGIADVVKLAMKNFYYTNPFGENVKMLLQVHDELVFEVREDLVEQAEKFIKQVMEDAESTFIKLLPCIVDTTIGNCWTKG